MPGPWCGNVVIDFGEVTPPFSACSPSAQQLPVENVFQCYICLCHDSAKSEFQTVIEFHTQTEAL